MKTESKIMSFQNAHIHYLCCGEGEKTAVFLHGKSFSAATWEETGCIVPIAAAGYRVICIDLPGYGKSEKNDLPSESLLEPLLRDMGIETMVITAPSFSGWYAFPFLFACPEKIKGFVGIAPRGIRKYRDSLHRIAAPVLAMWGENDDLVPIHHADILLQSVPNGRKTVLPGGSHAPYLSDPEWFRKEMGDFLSECFGK
ncbi:MAG: alpha/beta hydrolase [Desulfococcaceae bacterium]|jgi:abhydrolase domain-containing protein 14|nr:alpha/beta hydrolase [Desulfococcaceae bacterium]